MKKNKLKPFASRMVYLIAVVALLLSFALIDTTNDIATSKEVDNYEYVNSSIMTSNIPVINEEILMKPYVSDKVEISKKFYDVNSTDEEKQNSLIYYNDTYMQNSGILYKSNEQFDVVSILDGNVISIKKDEILGNVVEVRHSNNLISTYQGLSTVEVQKDQLLKVGDIIGKSGKLELGETLENALLFELIQDGKYVNPINYFDKKVNEL